MKALRVTFLLLTAASASVADELTVLSDDKNGVPPGRQLEKHLKQQFYQCLDERRSIPKPSVTSKARATASKR